MQMSVSITVNGHHLNNQDLGISNKLLNIGYYSPNTPIKITFNLNNEKTNLSGIRVLQFREHEFNQIIRKFNKNSL
jgi:hypothetical protein